jgi:hypothetical protein
MLESIIDSLRKALAEAAPHVYTALTVAEMRLEQITEEAQPAQGTQPKRPRRKSGKVVNLRPAE